MSGPRLFSNVSSLPPLGHSDHVVLQCHLTSSPKVVPDTTRMHRLWNYQEVDFEEVNKLLLQADWSPVSAAPTLDSAWDSWKVLFFSVVHKKIPSKRIGHIRRAYPWITEEIAALIRDKHKAWRTFKRSGFSEHLDLETFTGKFAIR